MPRPGVALRLAEDLATVDILSGGRLNPGLSVGCRCTSTTSREALYLGTADREDFGYERVARLLRLVAGEPVVVIPTDGASPAQRAKYEAYVAARTAEPDAAISCSDDAPLREG